MVEAESIQSWEEFEQLAQDKAYGPPSQVAHFFRGEADNSHTLKPSLLRRAPQSLLRQPDLARKTLLELEAFLTREFREHAEVHAHPTEVSERTDSLAWWAVMQHYGAPTRLLDWSTSPYVALYFAVQKNFDKPGAIWVLDFGRVFGNLTQITPKDPATLSIDERNQFLRKNKAKSCIFMYYRTRKSPRLIAQQHAFTVSTDVLTDYATVFRATPEESCLKKYEIRPDLKKRFLYKLWRMNLTSNSLFPGLDGVGRYVGELADLSLAASIGEVGGRPNNPMQRTRPAPTTEPRR